MDDFIEIYAKDHEDRRYVVPLIPVLKALVYVYRKVYQWLIG